MTVIIYFLLLYLLTFTTGDEQECVLNNAPLSIRWEKKLQEDLRSSKDPCSPLKSSSKITVTVAMELKNFAFSSDEEKLTIETWTHFSWKDERLKWIPDEYGGIKDTLMVSYKVRTPIIRLFNGVDHLDYEEYYFHECQLQSSGELFCEAKIAFKAVCPVKLDNFPYDVQECRLDFGQWENHLEELYQMNYSSHNNNVLSDVDGTQWVLSDYKETASAKSLNISITLERKALSLAAVVVYPPLVVSAVTLACLLLDVRCNIRVALICFNILGHFYWLKELGQYIPKDSIDSPTILLYYRGSLILTVFVFLATILLNTLCKKRTAPNDIVVYLNSAVYESYGRYLVFSQWCSDGTELADDNEFSKMWNKLVDSVNSACAVVVVCAYVGLYVSFMPQPPPIQY